MTLIRQMGQPPETPSAHDTPEEAQPIKMQAFISSEKAPAEESEEFSEDTTEESEESDFEGTNFPDRKSDNEIAILVMGVTGSGKSTFISRLAKEEVQIGHSLQSCTTGVSSHRILDFQGRRTYLIDTPGFDDTKTSDVAILQNIASTLKGMYKVTDLRFAGMIYMHRITDQRVSGSSLKCLRLFEKICGVENFPYVCLVTSMWNLLGDDRGTGEGREATLRMKDEFFGRMIAAGASMMQDNGSTQSATRIIDRIASEKSRVVTALQREMVKSDRRLGDTSAGKFLGAEMDRTRDRCQSEWRQLLEALQDAQKEKNSELIAALSEQVRQYEEKLRQVSVDEDALSNTVEELLEWREDWSHDLPHGTQRSERMRHKKGLVDSDSKGRPRHKKSPKKGVKRAARQNHKASKPQKEIIRAKEKDVKQQAGNEGFFAMFSNAFFSPRRPQPSPPGSPPTRPSHKKKPKNDPGIQREQDQDPMAAGLPDTQLCLTSDETYIPPEAPMPPAMDPHHMLSLHSGPLEPYYEGTINDNQEPQKSDMYDGQRVRGHVSTLGPTRRPEQNAFPRWPYYSRRESS